MNKNVITIPAKKKRPVIKFIEDEKLVGIYCRVSSTKKMQLRSLCAQISGLTQFVDSVKDWRLVDTYIDVAPGDDADREQFRRMLEDAAKGKLDIVVVKNTSRLGRDTVEVIQACRDLANNNCDVFAVNAGEFYSKSGPMLVEVTAAVDQADNENRRDNIRWGIRRELFNENSKIYNRICYGYDQDENGELVINEEQAVVVRKIFVMYLSGASILKIKRTLEAEGILAPRGGKKWSKKTIEKILTNKKYIGESVVTSQGVEGGSQYFDLRQFDYGAGETLIISVEENHPPIISEESFNKVQEMRLERSNITVDADGNKVRKNTHYSSKKKNTD